MLCCRTSALPLMIFIRVIDETGADYLYPSKYFVPIQLPSEVAKILPAGTGLRNGRPR